MRYAGNAAMANLAARYGAVVVLGGGCVCGGGRGVIKIEQAHLVTASKCGEIPSPNCRYRDTETPARRHLAIRAVRRRRLLLFCSK